jgi:2-alkyl-3-oxoalkanoate reductase
MRVLVTGADGFIGGALVPALRSAGHDVVGVVFTRPARDGEVRVDLTQPAELAQLPSEVAVVVHAAGVVDAHAAHSTHVTTARPGLMYAVNVQGTRHITEWATRMRVAHFVQLSSVAVYGPRVVGEQRDERTPRYGRALGFPYMRTKALAERVVEVSGLPYTLLRPCAVVGPGDTVLSRSFVSALAEGGLPLVSGASPLRRVSVLHIDGLAEAVVRTLARGALRMPLHVVDAELALWELALAYAQAAHLPLQFQHCSWSEELVQRADSGRMWLVASARFGQSYRTERLRRELGTWPVRPLEQALIDAVSSFQP